MQTTRFHEIECVPLANGALSLLVSQSIGPRILSLRLHGQANLFVELPGVQVQRSDGKVYRHYGGHRLWVAPEVMPGTYGVDDLPVEVSPIPDGLTVTQPLDPDTGIQKSLRIELIDDLPQVRVTHMLANLGSAALECAPWAITQLRTGGVAILPQNRLDTGSATQPFPGLLALHRPVQFQSSFWHRFHLVPSPNGTLRSSSVSPTRVRLAGILAGRECVRQARLL